MGLVNARDGIDTKQRCRLQRRPQSRRRPPLAQPAIVFCRAWFIVLMIPGTQAKAIKSHAASLRTKPRHITSMRSANMMKLQAHLQPAFSTLTVRSSRITLCWLLMISRPPEKDCATRLARYNRCLGSSPIMLLSENRWRRNFPYEFWLCLDARAAEPPAFQFEACPARKQSFCRGTAPEARFRRDFRAFRRSGDRSGAELGRS